MEEGGRSCSCRETELLPYKQTSFPPTLWFPAGAAHQSIPSFRHSLGRLLRQSADLSFLKSTGQSRVEWRLESGSRGSQAQPTLMPLSIYSRPWLDKETLILQQEIPIIPFVLIASRSNVYSITHPLGLYLKTLASASFLHKLPFNVRCAGQFGFLLYYLITRLELTTILLPSTTYSLGYHFVT